MNTLSELFERGLGITLVVLLALACLKVAAPFLPAFIWAGIITVSTWPLMRRLERYLGRRRKHAALAMSMVNMLLLVAPIVVLFSAVTERLPLLAASAQAPERIQLPDPPAKLAAIPFIGDQLTAAWHEAQADMSKVVIRFRPQLVNAMEWLLGQAAGAGIVVLQFLLAVFIAGALYINGEQAAAWCQRFALRVGGVRGVQLLDVAERTVRGVAVGVIGTAAVQGVLTGVGLAAAGIPAPAVLTLLSFLLAAVQIGTGPVWVVAVLWLTYHDQQGAAILLTAWGILVNISESILRSVLIKHGSHLPIVLVIVGVIGGLLAWGFMGIFMGATALALGYTLLQAWLGSTPALPPSADHLPALEPSALPEHTGSNLRVKPRASGKNAVS